MRIERFLTGSAARAPEKTAIVAGASRLSYAELDRASTRLAQALGAGGMKRGDRVVIFMDNCAEAAIAIFAVLKAGCVFVPINPSTKPDKLAYVLNNCRAVGIVTQARLIKTAEAAIHDAKSVALTVISGKHDAAPGRLAFEDAIAADMGKPLAFAGIELDLAMLIYTSGSTGFPKGVMMTHANVVAAAASITAYLENTPEDIILNVLPISFDYGLYQVLMAVKLGVTLVLEKSFAFPHAIFETMKRERVTGLPLVPTMAAMILQMKDLDGAAFPHLRYITNTAAALPPAHIARLSEIFPQAKLFSMYGLTECKRCTYLPPSELKRRPGSVGIAIPGTEAYVVTEDGRRAAATEPGELVIRGPHVMKGYWENPEATRRALHDGPFPWEKVLRTGDLFRTDEDGFLYFLGRKDDVFKSRGEKVSPKEIENVLYALPGIAEAAIVGVPDPVLGHAIKAVVALAPGSALGERDILRHCAAHLEDFMVPKLVAFRSALPKTESGKISRRLVAEALEAAE
jgi:long-chain acyl-CoA synthetase